MKITLDKYQTMYYINYMSMRDNIKNNKYNTGEKLMTARDLRRILFEIEDQEMTVRELRELLFEVEEQDKELTRKVLVEVEIQVRESLRNVRYK